MRIRVQLSLLLALLLVPTVAGAQVRYQPPQQFSRLDTRPLQLLESPYRIALADSLRRESYWQNGWWTGFGLGMLLGTVVSVGNREGYPHTFFEKVKASVFLGAALGVPLGVIGAMIGDASKK